MPDRFLYRVAWNYGGEPYLLRQAVNYETDTHVFFKDFIEVKIEKAKTWADFEEAKAGLIEALKLHRKNLKRDLKRVEDTLAGKREIKARNR